MMTIVSTKQGKKEWKGEEKIKKIKEKTLHCCLPV